MTTTKRYTPSRDSFVGLRCLYSEDGAQAEVTIIEDKSDAEWERYRIRVEKNIRPSPMFGAFTDKEFNIDKRRGLPFGSIWTLVPVQ